jgi:hypothetical protein
MAAVDGCDSSHDGGGGDGIFSATVNANDGMMAVASTTFEQLRMMTTIAATTIGQRSHHHRCHCFIAPPSHRRLR